MTNILELSRNFCYNNNREVKARMTRRTREAMASELQLPQHYVELDQQEMTYVDGGFFIGIGVSAGVATKLYSMVSNAVTKSALGIPGILGLIKMIPEASILISSLTSKLFTALIFIPLWGKIIDAAILATLVGATLYAGSQGYGFKIGVEIGWFSINGVCQYTN